MKLPARASKVLFGELKRIRPLRIKKLVVCIRCECSGKPGVRRGRFIISDDVLGPPADRIRILMGPRRSISDVVEVDGMCMISAIAPG